MLKRVIYCVSIVALIATFLYACGNTNEMKPASDNPAPSIEVSTPPATSVAPVSYEIEPVDAPDNVENLWEYLSDYSKERLLECIQEGLRNDSWLPTDLVIPESITADDFTITKLSDNVDFGDYEVAIPIGDDTVAIWCIIDGDNWKDISTFAYSKVYAYTPTGSDSTYYNTDLGFSVTLPDIWKDNYTAIETPPTQGYYDKDSKIHGVNFLYKDVEWTSLFFVSRVTHEYWEMMEADDTVPHVWQYLGEDEHYVFYLVGTMAQEFSAGPDAELYNALVNSGYGEFSILTQDSYLPTGAPDGTTNYWEYLPDVSQEQISAGLATMINEGSILPDNLTTDDFTFEKIDRPRILNAYSIVVPIENDIIEVWCSIYPNDYGWTISDPFLHSEMVYETNTGYGTYYSSDELGFSVRFDDMWDNNYTPILQEPSESIYIPGEMIDSILFAYKGREDYPLLYVLRCSHEHWEAMEADDTHPPIQIWLGESTDYVYYTFSLLDVDRGHNYDADHYRDIVFYDDIDFTAN